MSDHKSSRLGELVHLDVWGPYRVTSVDGFKYFLTIVDDFTHAVWVYLLKSKDEVSNWIIVFYNFLINHFDKRIKIIRSDNGTEFINHKVKEFCESKGIFHQTSCVSTPQQNGIAERKHRHLLNVARSLLFQSGIPLKYWSDCILTSTFWINRLPSSVLSGKSPFQLIYNKLPVFENLRVFGSLCFATRLNVVDKLSERSDKCAFLGYSNDKKGYKVLSLDNNSVFFFKRCKIL